MYKNNVSKGIILKNRTYNMTEWYCCLGLGVLTDKEQCDSASKVLFWVDFVITLKVQMSSSNQKGVKNMEYIWWYWLFFGQRKRLLLFVEVIGHDRGNPHSGTNGGNPSLLGKNLAIICTCPLGPSALFCQKSKKLIYVCTTINYFVKNKIDILNYY